jgi:hypothetical protein
MSQIDPCLAVADVVEASGATRFATSVVVTAADGEVLRCIPHPTGGILSPEQWRWLVLDESGTRHVGPAINDNPALGAIAERIAAWWEAGKELARQQSPSRYDASMRLERIGQGSCEKEMRKDAAGKERHGG